MNQARSTYKTDYVPFVFNRNDTLTENEAGDFCSSENIDDCLKYISQQFSALGCPSFYSNANSCPYAINCDIVKLLNGAFELIEKCRCNASTKEELEDTNRRLFSDLSALSKKNTHLKESLEQSDNRNKGISEKERQLKEKNNQLLQVIKSEKEESRKLASQLQQQKVAHQHEIRKHESSLNQMKCKLSQILTDKNPDKKVANISPSSLLQRNSKQRGKWKTGAVAKSSAEEMYNSVIFSYENRNNSMLKEIIEYRQCLEYILSEIVKIINILEDTPKSSVDLLLLRALWNHSDKKTAIEERFESILSKLREAVLDKRKSCHSESDISVNLQLNLNGNSPESPNSDTLCISSGESCKEVNSNNIVGADDSKLSEQMKQLEVEKRKLNEEKMELSTSYSFIEKAKADLEVQKLKLLKMAAKREMSKSDWHQNLNTVPSFAVITTKEGLTAVPSDTELRDGLNSLLSEEQVKSLTPLWEVDYAQGGQENRTSSEYPLHTSPNMSSCTSPTEPEPQTLEHLESCDLPKWATVTAEMMSVPSSRSETALPPVCSRLIEGTPSLEEFNPTLSSSQEQNLDLLKAAAEDLDKRRSNLSR